MRQRTPSVPGSAARATACARARTRARQPERRATPGARRRRARPAGASPESRATNAAATTISRPAAYAFASCLPGRRSATATPVSQTTAARATPSSAWRRIESASVTARGCYFGRYNTHPCALTCQTIRLYGRAFRARAITERDFRAFRRRYGDVLAPDAAADRRRRADREPHLLDVPGEAGGHVREGVPAQGARAGRRHAARRLAAPAPLPRALRDRPLRHARRLPDARARGRGARARRSSCSTGVHDADRPEGAALRGADVGREALSTVSRYLHEGGVDLEDPRAQALLARAAAVRGADRDRRGAAARRPAAASSCSSTSGTTRTRARSATSRSLRGLDVIQFVGGFEDDTIVFKRYTEETKAIHPRSLSDASWERVRRSSGRRSATPSSSRSSRGATTRTRRSSRAGTRAGRAGSRARRSRAARPRPDKQTAVVFSHVLWDANMFFGRDLFADQEEWFVETVRAACANDRVNWIVKLHPANVWKRRRDGVTGELDEHVAIREHIGELPPHVKLLEPDTDISTWSLFDVTDFGVTIRGSVGFELPCFGKPALTAGTGFYSGRGFTVDSDTARASTSPGSRGSRSSTPPAPERSSSRGSTRTRCSGCARRASRASARSTSRSSAIDDPSEATIEVSLRDAEELARGRGPTPARRLGRRLPRARLPRAVGRSCRSAAARAAGPPRVARRGSVVSAAAQPQLAEQTRASSRSRLPYG